MNTRVMEIDGKFYPQTYRRRKWLFFLSDWVTVQRVFRAHEGYSQDAEFNTEKEAWQCLEDLDKPIAVNYYFKPGVQA